MNPELSIENGYHKYDNFKCSKIKTFWYNQTTNKLFVDFKEEKDLTQYNNISQSQWRRLIYAEDKNLTLKSILRDLEKIKIQKLDGQTKFNKVIKKPSRKKSINNLSYEELLSIIPEHKMKKRGRPRKNK